MEFRTSSKRLRWLVLTIAVVASGSLLAQDPKLLPSQIMASGDALSEKRVTVEGVLINEGTNYFTNSRLTVKDASGTLNVGLPVRARLPLEAQSGRDGGERPPVLSDYLGKNVILQGTLRQDSVKGLGRTKILEVESIKILN